MAVSRVRAVSVPWDSQPQEIVGIDRSTPAGKAITTLIPFNGCNCDLVTGTHVIQGAGASNAPTDRGLSLRTNGTNNGGSIPIDLSAHRVLSVSWWMYWDAFANNDALAFEFTANTNANNGGFHVDPNCNFPFSGVFQVTVGDAGLNSASSFTRPSAAGWHHYALVWDRDVVNGTGQPTLRALWVDGVAQTMTLRATSYATATNFANSTLWFMCRGGSSLYATGNLQNFVLRAGYRLSDAEALNEYQNPWSLFEPRQQLIPVVSSVSAWWPGTESTLNGWTSSTGGTLASCISETTFSDAEWIEGPVGSNTPDFPWAPSSLPAGNYDFPVRAYRPNATGQIRSVFLDGGGGVLATGAWHALTGGYANYSDNLTIASVSTHFRLETQA